MKNLNLSWLFSRKTVMVLIALVSLSIQSEANSVTDLNLNATCLYSASLGEVIPVVTLTATFDGECVIDEICYDDGSGEVVCIDLIAEGIDLSNANPTYLMLGLESSGTYAVTVYYGDEEFGPVGVAIDACADEIPGCAEPSALNYDPEVTFPVYSLCDFPCVDVVFTFLTDCWGQESSWTLSQIGGPVIAAVGSNTYDDLQTYTWTGCINAGCYTLQVGDTFGDGLAGTEYFSCGVDGDFFMVDEYGNLLAQMGEANFGGNISFDFCVESAFQLGCTDQEACNYDVDNTEDDGSCVYPGCDDPYACNYMENPGCVVPCDYESCDYDCPGDYNGDGIRGTEDLLFMLSVNESTALDDLIADLDGNGIVGTGDWLVFLGLFGTPCPD